MTSISKIIIISFITLSVAGAVFLGASLWKDSRKLPVLGEPGHVAGPFSFVNQDGKTFTEKDVEGKITIVEYFFTTCPGICKAMNANLSQVYRQIGGEKDVVILSHTVDPEDDSVQVLKAYAAKMGVHNGNWQFLTGNKVDLYRAARNDYLLSVEDVPAAPGSAEDFIHTQYVALLDPQRRIRGFYDATDSASTRKMMADLELLRE